MAFTDYLLLVRRWGWLVVLAPTLAAGLAWWTSAQVAPVYRATATLSVDPGPPTANAQPYVPLVRRQPLLEATAQALGLNVPWQTLADQVHAVAVPQTEQLQISAVAGDPLVARNLADEVARQLMLQSLMPAATEPGERRAFVSRQLSALQFRIGAAQDEIMRLEARMRQETSARGVQDAHGQIAALRRQIATWQRTYAARRAFSQNGAVSALRVVEPAVASDTPVSPKVGLNVLVATNVGLLLALGGLVLEGHRAARTRGAW